jgi:Uncharacterised protein family (UPF0236)
MQDSEWLTAVLASAQALLGVVVQEVAAGLEQDLGTLERRLQAGLRRVGQVVVEGVVQAQAQAVARTPGACAQCGGRLRAVGLRPRTLLGLVGEYHLQRPYYACRTCGTPTSPLDARLGLGSGVLAPGLARVAAYEGSRSSFAEAASSLAEHHGVVVAVETVRALSEGLGALAEQDQQDRTTYAVPTARVPATLVVSMDGVYVPHRDGWYEAKLGRIAALGSLRRREVQAPPLRALGPSTYCIGLEATEAFWPRLMREAWRRGLGRGVRQVVLLGDGGEWIWVGGRAHLALPGVQVIEILDFYHASAYLADVARLVFPACPVRQQTWLAAVRHRLRHEGPTPVRRALTRLRPATPAAADRVRTALDYFTTHAPRMAYPRFTAQGLPIGSGMVESACKSVVQQRQVQAGMRWGQPGSQQIASLRALAHSGHWAAFWQTRPLHRLRLLPNPGPTSPATGTPMAPAEPPPPAVPPLAAADPAPPARAPAQRIQSKGKAWWQGHNWHDRPFRLSRSA